MPLIYAVIALGLSASSIDSDLSDCAKLDAQACNRLSIAYATGQGAAVDRAKAQTYYDKAFHDFSPAIIAPLADRCWPGISARADTLRRGTPMDALEILGFAIDQIWHEEREALENAWPGHAPTCGDVARRWGVYVGLHEVRCAAGSAVSCKKASLTPHSPEWMRWNVLRGCVVGGSAGACEAWMLGRGGEPGSKPEPKLDAAIKGRIKVLKAAADEAKSPPDAHRFCVGDCRKLDSTLAAAWERATAEVSKGKRANK